MKSLMLKLLTILALISVNLNANNEEEQVLSFFKDAISASKQYSLDNIQVTNKQDLDDVKGFRAYSVKIDLKLEGKDKIITLNDMVFTNGVVFSKDFLYLDTRTSIKDAIAPNADASFHKESHLIEGSRNAQHKLLVFSDPLCPSCMELLPELIDFVRANPKQFGLYYYNFPLSIHEGAKTLVKATMVAKKSDKNIIKKVYQEAFDFDKTDEVSVLEAFNKAMGTQLTLEDINKQEIVSLMEKDIKKAKDIMVRGTPTLYIDGKKDVTKQAYKDMVK